MWEECGVSLEKIRFFCIRPRHFRKTLWLLVLQHDYDVNQAENFAFLFG